MSLWFSKFWKCTNFTRFDINLLLINFDTFVKTILGLKRRVPKFLSPSILLYYILCLRAVLTCLLHYQNAFCTLKKEMLLHKIRTHNLRYKNKTMYRLTKSYLRFLTNDFTGYNIPDIVCATCSSIYKLLETLIPNGGSSCYKKNEKMRMNWKLILNISHNLWDWEIFECIRILTAKGNQN